VLTSKIEQCNDEFDAKAVCKALHGLQGYGDSEELRKLIATLSSKVEQCTAEINVEHIGDKLYGLRCMGISVRRILSALTTSHQSTGQLDAEAHRVLSSLRRLGDSEYVQKILFEFGPNMEHCTGTFEDVRAVEKVLLGLQHFRDSEEVENLVAVLIAKTTQLTENRIRQIVGKTLYSLKCLGNSEQTQQLLAAWAPEIEQGNVEPLVKQCDMALYGLEQAVATALYGLLDGEKSRTSLEEQVLSKGSRHGHPLEAQHVDREMHLDKLPIGLGEFSFCFHPSEMQV
jgi:hypothetical protein